MPLVRYEVRSEHTLANPELYRSVGRDDSEGLLEGVAMAGLVGIVRQLGDLAEFAAEIFRDLHDDVMTIVSRSQDIKARVIRLEADLPIIEKALLAEASQFRFAYTARSQWRASLPIDQNLCAQRELPCFVRNFYEDCRGPPRLFLLDKFDAAGQGACVRRYTDPAFFRLMWATSQLEKAEQAERERKALEAEKKSKVFNNGTIGPVLYEREPLSSAHLENLEGFTGDFNLPELRSKRLDKVVEFPAEGDLTPEKSRSPARSYQRRQLPKVAQGPELPAEGDLTPEESRSPARSYQRRQLPKVAQGPELPAEGDLTPEEGQSPEQSYQRQQLPKVAQGPELPAKSDLSPEEGQSLARSYQRRQLPKVSQGPVLAPLKISTKNTEDRNLVHQTLRPHDVDVSSSDEEGASDADHFVDALTTMGSESESDTDSWSRWDPNDVCRRRLEGNWMASLNHSVLKAHVEAYRQTSPTGVVNLEHKEEGSSSLTSLEVPASREGDANGSRSGESVNASVGQPLPDHGESEFFGYGVITKNILLPQRAPNGQKAALTTEQRDRPPLVEAPDTSPIQVHSSQIDDKKLANIEQEQSLKEYNVGKRSTPVSDRRIQNGQVSTLINTKHKGSPTRSNFIAVDDDRMWERNGQLGNVVARKPHPPGKEKLTARDYVTRTRSGQVLTLAIIEHRDETSRYSSLNGKEKARPRDFGAQPLAEGTTTQSIVPHSGEVKAHNEPEDAPSLPNQSMYELTYGSSSISSSDYTNLSSSSVPDDDEYTSSASSSPNATVFCALLSPPQSPPRISRGLMGSPALHTTSFQSGQSSPSSPPMKPLLSSSPTAVSARRKRPSWGPVPLRGSKELLPYFYSEEMSPPPPPPPPMSPPPEDVRKEPVVDPVRTPEIANQQFQIGQPKLQSFRNRGGPRLRTWTNPSESTVAATLQAIRQAAAIESDDEHRSDGT